MAVLLFTGFIPKRCASTFRGWSKAMPNWTSNRIYIEGEATDIRALLEAIKWQHELFDFNRIIPMPEILKRTVSGFQKFDGVEVRAWMRDKDANGKGIERPFTPEESEQLRVIGHSNWYDWCIANWGTKWNASDVDVSDDSEYGYAEILFNTAWCAPIPIFRKLQELFPGLEIDCRWRDEDDDPYPHCLEDVA
jgi:Ferredoxin-like domain in Api92-like protein